MSLTDELSPIELTEVLDKLSYLIERGYVDPVRKKEVLKQMIEEKKKEVGKSRLL